MHLTPANTELRCIFILTSNAYQGFFNTFDAKFKGARRTIKMHILEHHMLDCIRSHLAGCGLVGEQGAESIHSRFNSLAACLFTRQHNLMDSRVFDGGLKC